MAKLTAKTRNALPTSKFAGPDRSYPVDTPGRAVAAKGRATQAVKAGRMSSSEEARIDAKANRELGKGKPAHPAGREVERRLAARDKGKR